MNTYDGIELTDEERAAVTVGRQQQIRRFVNPQPSEDDIRGKRVIAPFKPGDRIWFTYYVCEKYGKLVPCIGATAVGPDGEIAVLRLATRQEAQMEATIEKVRLARLQDYSGQDMSLEGTPQFLEARDPESQSIGTWWDRAHPYGPNWHSNPWMWVIEFDYRPKQ